MEWGYNKFFDNNQICSLLAWKLFGMHKKKKKKRGRLHDACAIVKNKWIQYKDDLDMPYIIINCCSLKLSWMVAPLYNKLTSTTSISFKSFKSCIYFI